MNRNDFEKLIAFCAAQRTNFDTDAWRKEKSCEMNGLIVATKVLAMSLWFGHQQQLCELDVEFSSKKDLTDLLLEQEFELPRFIDTLKQRIFYDEKRLA